MSRPTLRHPRARFLLALSLCALGAQALYATPAAAAVARTSLPAIEPQVMCVVCKIPLNIAQSPQADRERAFIQGLVDQGLTQAQIKRALVAQYGPGVLATPSDHGFGLVAYLVPLLAVVLAIGLLLALLPRWRRRARHPPPPRAPLSAEQRDRLDADMARHQG
jgi:cytochrome c-type biogenesis protein CcmH